MGAAKESENFLAVGDVHGHLQLTLCMAARLQRESGRKWDGIFLCGDVGTFSDVSRLDNATVAHARTNMCELEFPYQWAAGEQAAPWLAWIFREQSEGGLGLVCPVVMVHGNHEGFEHLAGFAGKRPRGIVVVEELPAIDAFGAIRYLPSGCVMRTPGGHVVGGIGGIEPGQRRAKYHDMAFITEAQVAAIRGGPRLDILLTHQGPACLQGEIGSPQLDVLVENPARAPAAWFHGHGMKDDAIREVNGCRVVPLGDVPFVGKGARFGDPGITGYAQVTGAETLEVMRIEPAFWREYRQKLWTRVDSGWVCPDLAKFATKRLGRR